jgi:hypothetical protein
MTFEEAKKLLEKEFAVINLHKSTEPFEFDDSNWFGYEKPSVLEAFRVLAKEGYYVTISGHDYDMRKKRLQKEYEKNTKTLGPGEEQPNEGNPALKEAASQFNDALLDELRKKIAAYKKLYFYDTKTLKRKDEIIEELRDKNAELLGMVERMKEDVKDIDTNLNAANETNKCLNKKVVELTKIKGDLNSWISGLYFCIHHNNDNYKYKLKRLGKEIAKLNSIIHDKNAVLSDVAEELRLTKIREKNLTELCQKYVGENEKLKKELADKVVDKIDAQALKSAESALAWKEKVVTYKDMVLAYYEKKIAEKDEVIADLGKELAAQKGLKDEISLKYIGVKRILKLRRDECEKLKEELEEANNRIKAIHNASKEYCEYGIAAEKMIQKMAKAIVNPEPVSSEDFEKYRLWANGYRFNPQLPEIGEEEEKKPSLFRDDSVGAVTNQKDCSPVKDTHPTEDNPEEVELDEILERVRKALEEGHTVSIDYDKAEEGGDQSAIIVECGKDIDDVFEEIKRLCQE